METALRAVILDFGGVIAEEGFREGLLAIGSRNGLDPTQFFQTADRLIYETGYLTGRADEAAFWKSLRQTTGISGDDNELREEILSRFVLRPEMMSYADRLKAQGLTLAILSDQTNWLEEINAGTPFFRHFDAVFNSFRIHKSKRDASVFKEVCASLGVKPAEALFVDDNGNHIERAAKEGLRTIHFTSVNDFERRIAGFLGAGRTEK